MLNLLLKHREALLGAVIVLMIAAIGSRISSFIAPGNLVEMFNDTSILIILALGQMMVLLAVLGGINILGGSGSMVGVIIAAFLMGLVTFGLSLLNVPGIVMSVIIGAMLIVVISLPILTRRVMSRKRI
jgi:rhamnose transport system permease protein